MVLSMMKNSKLENLLFPSPYGDIGIYWWKEFDTYKVGTFSSPCGDLYVFIPG